MRVQNSSVVFRAVSFIVFRHSRGLTGVNAFCTALAESARNTDTIPR